MATEKGLEAQPFEDSSLSVNVETRKLLAENNPEEVRNEAFEPVELESEKELPVASVSGKMNSAESAEDTVTVGKDESFDTFSPASVSENVETEKQPSSSSLRMDTEEFEDTTGKHDSRHSSDDDDTAKKSRGCGRETEQAENESVEVKGEKAETGVDNKSSVPPQPETSSDESAENEESNDDDDDDCQIIDSVSPSSKEFKLKQTRVHDWVQSPSQTSYKDKPSFKHNLPHWVDHFDNFFTFVKQGTDSGKKSPKPKPFYVFQCKLCVGVARKKNKICRVRHIGNFLTHLKFHPKHYTKFATDNPRLVTKKKPKRCD